MERQRTTGDHPGAAHLGEQVAGRERVADVRFGEGPPRRGDHAGAPLDAARGERDVGCDDDIAAAGVCGDPVVRGVEPRVHDLEREIRLARNPHPASGHEGHVYAMALGDPIGLVLHGAGIGIHVDVQGPDLR